MADIDSESLNGNLFFLTTAFSRKLSREADEVFASVGLSSSHALLLLMIRKNPEIQPSQLAEELHLKPSTITRLVQKLERRQLVRKQPEGRATAIACTSNGKEVAENIDQQWQKLIASKQDQLGERYVEVLSEMISNALDKLDDH
jgi:DNA-binding MarR family transcriptional regulator